MYIKVTGHSKIKFFEGFPPSVRDFFNENMQKGDKLGNFKSK